MTLGRCPLSIFCSCGTPPRAVEPTNPRVYHHGDRCLVRKRGRGGQTQHRKELFGLEKDSSERIPCEGKRRCLAGSYGKVTCQAFQESVGRNPTVKNIPREGILREGMDLESQARPGGGSAQPPPPSSSASLRHGFSPSFCASRPSAARGSAAGG